MVAVLGMPARASETITYGYDAHGRLTTVNHSGSVNNGLRSTIALDPTANRTSYVVDATGGTLAVADAGAVTERTALTFTVTRSGVTSASVTVNYAAANGTASAGSDYTATSGTLTFAAGETSKTISVPTVNDTIPEPAKTVLMNLSAATGGAIITRAQASGTVNDNDTTAITFAVNNAAAVTEGGTLVFTVTKSGGTYLNTSVNYATANGTATAGSDYTAVSGTLTFAPTETSKTVSVSTIDDFTVESPETVLLNLSSPSGGSITTAQASGTINDNDFGPITAANPSFAYASQQVSTIAIATLAHPNGNNARIASFSVPSGKGSASIAADGQSVTYTAETMDKPVPCDPAVTDRFTIGYTVQNTANGAITSGTASIAVTGPPGGKPTKGVCP